MAGEHVIANIGCQRQRYAYWAILAGFTVFWIVVSALGAPHFGGTDVFVYKDAGCNLALGHGFTSLGLPGTPDLDSHLFASNAPGVPFLFGLFALAFGCNAYASTYFDLIIAILAVAALAYTLERTLGQPIKVSSAILMGLVLPSGLLFVESDRPDMLGFALFVVACSFARSSRTIVSQFGGPLAAGLCGLVFPFGGALSGLAVWGTIASRCHRPVTRLRSWKVLINLTAKLIAIYLVPIIIVVAVYAVVDPAAWLRFSGNSFGTRSGMGAVFHNSLAQLFHHSIFSSGPYSLSLVLSSSVAACLVLYLMFATLRIQSEPQSIFLGFVMLCFILLPLTLFPAQNNYMAWVRSALLILLLTSESSVAIWAQRHHITTLLLAIICLANLPFVWLGCLIELQSKPSYDAASGEAARFADAVAAKDDGKLVLVPSSVYFLYKARLPKMADPAYVASLVQPSTIGGAVFCFVAHPAGELAYREAPYLPPLTLYSSASGHYVPTIFGVRLTYREWGWSCDHHLAQ